MAGRGQQTFNKRQKEQQRKERQQEKMAGRLQRKKEGPSAQPGPEDGELSIAEQLALEMAEEQAAAKLSGAPRPSNP